jgi:arabinofuranosyltransferase
LGATAVALVLAFRDGDAMDRACATGITLYLLYVVKIGGDFMSGRFLTAPLFVSVTLLARRRLDSRRTATALLAGTIVVGALAPHATWRTGPRAGGPPAVDIHGIADERAFYLDSTGLAARLRSGREIEHPARVEALRAKSEGPAIVRLSTWGCGIYGYYAGPGIHIVDEWALGDALLARLPAVRDLHWRIGHFTRAVPDGYLDTLATGRNQIRDPGVAKFWERLAPVIRAPLFAAARWKAMLDFALGRPARLLDADRWRLLNLIAVDAAQMPVDTGAAFGDSGLDIRFDPPSRATRLEIGLVGGSAFLLEWRRGSRVLASGRIDLPERVPGEAALAVDVPEAARDGFERMRVLPLRGDGPFRLRLNVR